MTPRTIRVGNADLPFSTIRHRGSWGGSSLNPPFIWVGEWLSPIEQEETALHEVVHCILDQMGVSEELHTEAFVEDFSQRLFDTLRVNGWLDMSNLHKEPEPSLDI